MDDLIKFLMIIILLGIVFNHGGASNVKRQGWLRSDADDTDGYRDGKLKDRSGLTLYIDYGTGCHYLKQGFFGGLTPRLDADGNHICESGEHKIYAEKDMGRPR